MQPSLSFLDGLNLCGRGVKVTESLLLGFELSPQGK